MKGRPGTRSWGPTARDALAYLRQMAHMLNTCKFGIGAIRAGRQAGAETVGSPHVRRTPSSTELIYFHIRPIASPSSVRCDVSLSCFVFSPTRSSSAVQRRPSSTLQTDRVPNTQHVCPRPHFLSAPVASR
jgi:hypothetical protein